MHELAITQSLLDISLAEAAKAGAGRVTVIRLKIGALTGIVPDSVAFYLEMLAKGTPAEGAKLVADVMPVTSRCAACDLTFPVEDLVFLCPRCAGPSQLVTGRELSVESLEVD